MPRDCCAGGGRPSRVIGGQGVDVRGDGSWANPYIVEEAEWGELDDGGGPEPITSEMDDGGGP